MVAEWARISGWTTPQDKVADGFRQVTMASGHTFDQATYKDPALRIRDHQAVPTTYGATDPTEDFAEFHRLFYTDPAAAMDYSPEKFLYLNNVFHGGPVGHFNKEQVLELARQAGYDEPKLAEAWARMREAVNGARAHYQHAAQFGEMDQYLK
jgi:hypothetical protein